MGDKKYYENLNMNQRLAHCVEECGELLSALGKSQRWGLNSYNPELLPVDREVNIDWVKREWVDLEGAMSRMIKDYEDGFDNG